MSKSRGAWRLPHGVHPAGHVLTDRERGIAALDGLSYVAVIGVGDLGTDAPGDAGSQRRVFLILDPARVLTGGSMFSN